MTKFTSSGGSLAIALILGLATAEPALAGKYNKAIDSCRSAIQTDLSIPDESYRQRLNHVKSFGSRVELWFDVSHKGADTKTAYAAYCKARLSSGEILALETTPLAP